MADIKATEVRHKNDKSHTTNIASRATHALGSGRKAVVWIRDASLSPLTEKEREQRPKQQHGPSKRQVRPAAVPSGPGQQSR